MRTTILSVGVLLFLSCATTQQLTAAPSNPAGVGTVRTDEDNGNTKVRLHVKHLAPAPRLASGATTYVVWVQPPNAQMQSVGVLRLNEDLEGRLETTTPHKQFRIAVTPEPSAQVEKPSHDPVFTADISGRD